MGGMCVILDPDMSNTFFLTVTDRKTWRLKISFSNYVFIFLFSCLLSVSWWHFIQIFEGMHVTERTSFDLHCSRDKIARIVLEHLSLHFLGCLRNTDCHEIAKAWIVLV